MDPSDYPDYSGRQLGNWKLLRLIGIGGFGCVYEAQNQLIGKPAAVKVLHPHLTSHKDALSRFLKEANLASQARHPGIVEFYDGGFDENGLCYMVMGLVRGTTLFDELARGPLGALRTARLGERLSDALFAVHTRGVVHRDLKPDNILLLEDAREADTPKILDFGIAKLREGPQQTVEGALIGTLMYMSPEQCRGAADLDYRSDLYSLGVILYECLIGVPPFRENGIPAWVYAHVAKPVPDPAMLLPDAPAKLCHLLLRMLAKEPADRPASMDEVRVALRDLGGELAAGMTAPMSRAPLPPGSRPGTPVPSSRPGTPMPSSRPGTPVRSTIPLPPSPASWQAPRVPGPQRTTPLPERIAPFSRSLTPQPAPPTGPSPPPRSSALPWRPVVVVLGMGVLGLGLYRLNPGGNPPATPPDLSSPVRQVFPDMAAPAARKMPRLPAEMVLLDSLAVGRAQVRIGEFHDYVKETQPTHDGKWPWEFKVPEHLPMNNVGLALARRYCAWRYPDNSGRLPRQKELALARSSLPEPDGPMLQEEWTEDAAGQAGDRGSIKIGFRCAFTIDAKGTTP